MLPYVAFISVFAISALTINRQQINGLYAGLAILVITFFVGLRHHVGMDWNNYLRIIFEVHTAYDIPTMLAQTEPGFAILLAISAKTGLGMYFANFITALVFGFGIVLFARTCPAPRLAIVAAIPFLTVVIAMSANRQSLAVGIILILLAKWKDSSLATKVAIIVLAGMFHYSAVMFLLFLAWETKLPRIVRFGLATVFGLAAFYYLNQVGRVDYATATYLSDEEFAQSSGSYLQMLLTVVPALLLPLFWTKRDILFGSPIIFRLAVFTLVMTPFGYLFPVVTARILIYSFPMTMYAISALPLIVSPKSRPLVTIALLAALFGQMLAWLSYSENSKSHFPYDNLLFIDAMELETGVNP